MIPDESSSGISLSYLRFTSLLSAEKIALTEALVMFELTPTP